MSNNKKWVPALESEVKPSLPLHKDGYDWITAYYEDGRKEEINLKRLFLDSKQIKKVELKDAVSTASLYRILVSIAYKLVLDTNEYPKNEEDWSDFKYDLIKGNNGFDKEKVEAYFEEFDERFYLIHPTYPFMQDPSLYKFFADKIPELSDDDRRKELSKKLRTSAGSISAIYPKALPLSTENGAKVPWGLPLDDVYTEDLSLNGRISTLMTSLLYNTYAHSATNRGAKMYANSMNIKDNDAYHKAHFYRCAIHYVPQGDNLFQTLIVPMDFIKKKDFAEDLPIWEQDPNSLGFLGYYGYNVNVDELSYSYDAPRSSVNSTHLSLLFFPEADESLVMRENAGRVKQMRRPLINVKHLNQGSEKYSWARSWNPFTATKEDTKKALKQVSGVSVKTSMQQTNLFKIPLYREVKEITKPFALSEYDEYQKLFKVSNRNVNVHVLCADASQDKSFSNISFTTSVLTQLTDSPEQKDRLDDWFSVGNDLNYRLGNSVKNALSRDGKAQIDKESVGMQVSEMFWIMYTKMYHENVSHSGIIAVGEPNVKEALRRECFEIYEVLSDPALSIDPPSYSKHYAILGSKFNEIMEGKK